MPRSSTTPVRATRRCGRRSSRCWRTPRRPSSSSRSRRSHATRALAGLSGLSIGQRLGAYQIIAKLGAGGMGEVYRGRDTRLGRDVAIKILPVVFAADPERLARFEREARAPGLVESPTHRRHLRHRNRSGRRRTRVRALVMELVEGADAGGAASRADPCRSLRRWRSRGRSPRRSRPRTSRASSIAI